MINSIAVLIEFQSPSQREIVIKLLTRETRPDFDDELKAWEVPVFEQLEDVEFPDEMIKEGENLLFVDWWEIEEELDELDEKLLRCGGKIQKAQIHAEEGFFEDGGDNLYGYGLFYKRIKNELVMVDSAKRKLKMPEDFPKNSDIPQQMQALMQDF
jgi:hypothetical protein